MGSNQSAKEEIKRASDIVALIGQYVQLRKAGRNFVGLCPFHTEKAPSFTVNPERQSFHCFGCKKGGDVFSFWMDYHHVTFVEALKDLGEKYQIHVSDGYSPAAEKERSALRNELFRINGVAADYFENTLNRSPKGAGARAYFKERRLSKKTIASFRLGYAPDEWEGLVRVLRKDGTDLDKALQAGLIVSGKRGGYYDRFRGRLIFPIFDMREKQKIVGFGGRVLDDSMPKYLNSPETPLFHKGKFLYGFHEAYQTMREKGRAIVVEGYMDLLALSNHGLTEIVATLGTALTPEHIRRIKGIVKEAVVVFDSDSAGIAAVLKSLPLFLNEGLSARAAVLPEGHDPDSYVNEMGPERFLERIDKAPAIFDFYLDQKLKNEASDVETKVKALNDVLSVLAQISSRPQKALYIRRISERSDVDERVLWSELETVHKRPGPPTRQSGSENRMSVSVGNKRVGDGQFLNLLLHHCGAKAVVRLMDSQCRVLISEPTVMEIVDAFLKKYQDDGPFPPENLEEDIASEDGRCRLREALMERSFYLDEEVEQAVREFEQKIRQKRISASFQEARKSGDLERQNALLKKLGKETAPERN